MKYEANVPLTKEILVDATEGYSSCPPEVVRILSSWVKPGTSKGSLFDNCAGDGDAAAALANTWHLRPVLVEPDPDRHRACLRFDPIAINAPSQTVLGKGPTVWFFNPPFDLKDASSSMERHIFCHALQTVPIDGTLCIWLFHKRALLDDSLMQIVNQRLSDVHIATFPKPLFSTFQQVCITGFWNETDLLSSHRKFDIRRLEEIRTCSRHYTLRAVGTSFCVKKFPRTPRTD